jgi:glycosyltransferase involved in cell wall biosynthesis
MAKLDVIVPIYNVESYLEKCLDSLLNQDYNDFFVRLINDGSTDQSIRIAEHYESNFPNRFKVYTKVNGGLSDARNYGIDHSISEYIAFIDSDDYIDPSMFSKMMALVNDNTDVVCCDLVYVYENGDQKVASAGNDELLTTPLGSLRLNNSACNKIFRRSLFNEIRFPKGKWYEDLATIPCVLFRANSIKIIHEPFYYYYQREGSIAHIKNDKMFDIYWSIQHIEENIGTELEEWNEIKQYLLIEHGLFLTSLRIKKMSNYTDRKEYYRKNINHLKSMFKHWYLKSLMMNYPIKTKIIFTLFYFGRFDLSAAIFKG